MSCLSLVIATNPHFDIVSLGKSLNGRIVGGDIGAESAGHIIHWMSTPRTRWIVLRGGHLVGGTQTWELGSWSLRIAEVQVRLGGRGTALSLILGTKCGGTIGNLCWRGHAKECELTDLHAGIEHDRQISDIG